MTATPQTATESSSSQVQDGQLRIGDHVLHSRLIVGTGKYDTLELMRDSLAASGADVVTVAVRRERMYDLHSFPTRRSSDHRKSVV